jgi:hypothetical protein
MFIEENPPKSCHVEYKSARTNCPELGERCTQALYVDVAK